MARPAAKRADPLAPPAGKRAAATPASAASGIHAVKIARAPKTDHCHGRRLSASSCCALGLLSTGRRRLGGSFGEAIGDDAEVSSARDGRRAIVVTRSVIMSQVPLDPAAAPSVVRMRVRFNETDLMGIRAPRELRFVHGGGADRVGSRRRGVAYADWAAHGVHLPVVELSVQYRAPVRFDEEIDVHVSLVEVGAASVRFAYRLVRASDGTLCTKGSTRLACIDSQLALRRISRRSPSSSASRSTSGDERARHLRHRLRRACRDPHALVPRPELRPARRASIGIRAEGVGPEALSVANAFAASTELEFRRNEIHRHDVERDAVGPLPARARRRELRRDRHGSRWPRAPADVRLRRRPDDAVDTARGEGDRLRERVRAGVASDAPPRARRAA